MTLSPFSIHPNSLLATAWPALQEEVRVRFEEWSPAGRPSAKTTETEIASVAASANSGLVVMPSRPRPTLLRGLPPNYQLGRPTLSAALSRKGGAPRISDIELFFTGRRHTPLRPPSRATCSPGVLGIAVHALLEEAARLRTAKRLGCLQNTAQRIEPPHRRAGTLVWHRPNPAAAIAAQALHWPLSASQDPIAQWILSPHADRHRSSLDRSHRKAPSLTVRVDRVFRAGPDPGSEGKQAWWIVDYKTAHSGAPGQNPSAALPEFRKLFRAPNSKPMP